MTKRRKPPNDQQLELIPAHLRELVAAGQAEIDRRKAWRETVRKNKLRGRRPPGLVPYGKRLSKDGRMLEVEPREAAVIAFIVERRKERDTYQEITAKCTAKGFRTRRGTKFVRQLVERICRRELPELRIPRGRRPKKSKPKEAA